MSHDTKRHYDGHDAKCKRCGAAYRAFCCMNVGEMCDECFRRAVAAVIRAQNKKSANALIG